MTTAPAALPAPGPGEVLARHVWTFRLFATLALVVCLGAGVYALFAKPVTLGATDAGSSVRVTTASRASADVLAVLAPGALAERTDCLLSTVDGQSIHVGVLTASSSGVRALDGRTWTPVAGIGTPRAGDVVTCRGPGVEALRVVSTPRQGPLMLCGVTAVAGLGAAMFSVVGANLRRRGRTSASARSAQPLA